MNIHETDDRFLTATLGLWAVVHETVSATESLVTKAFTDLGELCTTLDLDPDERDREFGRLAGRLHRAVRKGAAR